MSFTRRDFVRVGGLWLAGGLVVGCKSAPERKGAVSSDTPPAAPVLDPTPKLADPSAPYGRAAPTDPVAEPHDTRACGFTETNIEGPYYRPGAPTRADLVDPGMGGTRLEVSGRVLAAGCTTPLAGVMLDIWQADKDGHYDNDGHDGQRGTKLVLRGKVTTNARGEYSFRTILPGRYLNGDDYRPAHIHVKVAAPGRRALTTQLYFEGDPQNAKDAFIKPSLIMRLEGAADAKQAKFDFVLRDA